MIFFVPQFSGLSATLYKSLIFVISYKFIQISIHDNDDNALGSCDVEYTVGKISCFHWLVIEAIFLKSCLYGCFIAIKA